VLDPDVVKHAVEDHVESARIALLDEPVEILV